MTSHSTTPSSGIPASERVPLPGPGEPWDVMADTWGGIDSLGREMPTHEDVGPPRDRTAMIFYFTWHGSHGYDEMYNPTREHGQGVLSKEPGREYKGPYDLTKILAGEAEFGPWHAMHHWGESQFGYYVADDPWVIRRHAHMLVDAGVDAVALDVTNSFVYPDNIRAILGVFDELNARGEKTPKVTFLTNSAHVDVVERLYREFYSTGQHDSHWVMHQGKPVMMASSEGLSDELLDYFTLRQSWAWSNPAGWFGDGQHKWPWLDNWPQNYGWDTDPDVPEFTSVSVAQHSTTNIGRSHFNNTQPPVEDQHPERGIYFGQQFDRALDIDPPFLFITGWNEWIGMRFPPDPNVGMLGKTSEEVGYFFVDIYNEEYNRDIEPTMEPGKDALYYQMAQYLRRYKGARPLPPATPPVTIPMDGDFAPWDSVGPEYRDHLTDTMHRDHIGWGRYDYVNETGRNNIVIAKVARDSENVYFYARTEKPLTDPSDPDWMTLFIRVPGSDAPDWEGFHYAVNRAPSSGGQVVVEACAGGWAWRATGTANIAIGVDELAIAVPRAALGPAGASPLDIEFKWVDNMQNPGDIMDFMKYGDAAPNGRFTYRYKAD